MIPELAASGPDAHSTLARQARSRLHVCCIRGFETISSPTHFHFQGLAGPALEKLALDVYDEVERREVEAAWEAGAAAGGGADRFVVPFLPVNPDFTATRNQSRQKLAKFTARELASLIIALLTEVARMTSPPQFLASH